MAKTWMDFDRDTLYRDEGKMGQPLSRAEVATIWNAPSFPRTGSMWIEHLPQGRMLCAKQREDGPVHEIGIVANTVRMGTGDFSQGHFIKKFSHLKRLRQG